MQESSALTLCCSQPGGFEPAYPPDKHYAVYRMRGAWGAHFSGRMHFHGAQAPPPKSESSASRIFRHSGMTLVFKTTFEVFTRVGPDNSLERLTERSVGLVTDRPSNVYELFVTLL
jgi:hypothetical protein